MLETLSLCASLSLLVACGVGKGPRPHSEAGSAAASDAGASRLDGLEGFDAPPSSDVAFADPSGLARDGAPPAADAQSPPGDASSLPPPNSACQGQAPGPRDYTLTMTFQNRPRSALVHLPPSYDGKKPLPLVFNNHGNAHAAKLQADMSGLDARADARGIITVTPQGTGLIAGWNVGNSPIGGLYAAVDDVGFFRALLDELERTRCVDKRRVYCTGFSLGGSMCYRLACDMSDRIAAFASVAGPDGTVSCSPKRPLSLLHVHGTADTFAGYGSDGGLNKGVLGYVSAHAKRVGCSANTSVSLTKGAVTCKQFAGCPQGVEVGHCDVNGFGHSWPGGKGWLLSGPVNQDIDASAMVLDFFGKHAL